ncbi:hypothetical protein BDF19DRAFT_450561 [Syncephalis fuscata]|nr:hypothetical protein BDF19DRAFT_450561 [Syncephalis fuscata]
MLRFGLFNLLINLIIIIHIWLLCFSQSISALVAFQVGNQTNNFTTYDFLEAKQTRHTSRGVLLIPEFDARADCRLKYPNVDFIDPSLNVKLQQYTGTGKVVVAISAISAAKHGCRTAMQVGVACDVFCEELKKAGSLAFDTAMYLLEQDLNDLPGPPAYLEYASIVPYLSGGSIKTNVALLPIKDFLKGVNSKDLSNELIMVDVKQEAGPWDVIYSSRGYMAYKYIIVILIVYFISRSIYIIFQMIRFGKWPALQRSIIFGFSLIGLVCSVPMLLLARDTLASVVLYLITKFSGIIAFQAFLLLWHSLIVKVHNTWLVRSLYYCIWMIFILLSTSNILHVLSAFGVDIMSQSQLFEVGNTIFATRSMRILIFGYFGWILWKKRHMANANTAAFKTLTQMIQISIIFMLSLLVHIIAQSMMRYRGRRYRPTIGITLDILAQMAQMARFATMVLVLDTYIKQTRVYDADSEIVLTNNLNIVPNLQNNNSIVDVQDNQEVSTNNIDTIESPIDPNPGFRLSLIESINK